MNSLSTILKQRRKALGLTLAQIADTMGVTEATVQRWESGNIKSVRYEKIAKLSNVLGVAPSTLMGWEPDGSGQLLPADPSPKLITPAEARLLDLHRQLNEEGQVRLHDYADDLVSSGKYIKTDPSHLVEDQEENVK